MEEEEGTAARRSVGGGYADGGPEKPAIGELLRTNAVVTAGIAHPLANGARLKAMQLGEFSGREFAGGGRG